MIANFIGWVGAVILAVLAWSVIVFFNSLPLVE